MADVVILETIRGGRDPDEYYHVITGDLADQLDTMDPWRDLGELETDGDRRILVGYLRSEDEARRWCRERGHVAREHLMDAVGY